MVIKLLLQTLLQFWLLNHVRSCLSFYWTRQKLVPNVKWSAYILYSDCKVPIKFWQMVTYLNIILARSMFFFFDLDYKCMRCTSTFTLFFLMPFHILWTLLGTIWTSTMMSEEFVCVSRTITYTHLVSRGGVAMACLLCVVSLILPYSYLHHDHVFIHFAICKLFRIW